jgi:hypothetical protein
VRSPSKQLFPLFLLYLGLNMALISNRMDRPSDFVISPQGRQIGAEIWDEQKKIWQDKVGVDVDAIVQLSA